MSGHSKFANIKHKKEKNDAAKGKVFTRIGREIAVAVKEGGADPANNSIYCCSSLNCFILGVSGIISTPPTRYTISMQIYTNIQH